MFQDLLDQPCPVLAVSFGGFIGLQDAGDPSILVLSFPFAPTDIAVVAIVTNHHYTTFTEALSAPLIIGGKNVYNCFSIVTFDGFVKSQKAPFSVIPVKTGIQGIQEVLDFRSPPARGQASFSGSDDLEYFLRTHHFSFLKLNTDG